MYLFFALKKTSTELEGCEINKNEMSGKEKLVLGNFPLLKFFFFHKAN